MFRKRNTPPSPMRMTLVFLLLLSAWIGCTDMGDDDVTSPEAAEWTMLVVGDWGVEGAYHQIAVAQAMGVCAEQHPERIVLSVGDNFYDSGVTSVDDPQWRASFEDIYTHPALQCPWYITVGNHDYYGNEQAQIDYSELSNRWNLPSFYYTKTFPLGSTNGIRLIVLDSVMLLSGEQEERDTQLAWLDSLFAVNEAEWTIISSHYPLYSGGAHGSSAELIEMLENRFQDANVDACFSGHEHDQQYLVSGGIDYYVSGTGARIRETSSIDQTLYASSITGFLCAQFTPDSLVVTIYNSENQPLYETIRTH